MDIQTRKIEFVQEFLKLQNEDLISRFENLLLTNKSITDNDFSPMTMADLNIRIDKSMNDSENGKLTTSNNLMSEIEKWG